MRRQVWDSRFTAEGREVGWVFETYCSCQAGEDLQQLHRQDQANYEFARWYDVSGVPPRFKNFRLKTSPNTVAAARLTRPTWAPCDHERKDTENFHHDCEHFRVHIVNHQEWTGSWFLWGGYGVGKTGLAVGYLRQWIEVGEDGLPAIFRTVPDVLAELRDTYNANPEDPKERDVIRRYATAPLLVLDDLGAEQIKGGNADWAQDRLYQIIGKRHSSELTTVFTSNLSMTEVSRKLGERLSWRILEMCTKEHILHIVGKNLRDR